MLPKVCTWLQGAREPGIATKPWEAPSLRCDGDVYLMPRREVVPLAASGLLWSPEAHKAFPPRFRAAARALLLANHRGLAAAADSDSPSRSGVAPAGSIAEGTGTAFHLPSEVLLLILGKAAHPPAAWVPALQPGQPDTGDSLTSRMCRAAEQVLREGPSARRLGPGLVVAMVGVLVLGHGRRRRSAKAGMAPVG